MAMWLKVGIAVFVTGAILDILLITVALAGILAPVSHTWATLNIVTMTLLITGLIIISISRARK
jgi:hypothetical protein